MELAERKKKILSAVIESYINTGEPIGSKALINETGLEVSSATVRNDLADLTNKGYLVQPHTSAGRIPTLQGYRYYIDNLMKITPVTQGRLTDESFIPEKISLNALSNTVKSSGFKRKSQRNSFVFMIPFEAITTAIAVCEPV